MSTWTTPAQRAVLGQLLHRVDEVELDGAVDGAGASEEVGYGHSVGARNGRAQVIARLVPTIGAGLSVRVHRPETS